MTWSNGKIVSHYQRGWVVCTLFDRARFERDHIADAAAVVERVRRWMGSCCGGARVAGMALPEAAAAGRASPRAER